MNSSNPNPPHEIISDCIINTHNQTQKSKEFEIDVKKMTKTKQPHEIISDCIINTHNQTQKSKEFQIDVEKMTKTFHEFTSKYGDKIAGFYILKMKDAPWIINVATDGEIK